MKYDVIIIGAGLGGLECGSILSRQGLSVLVLEQQRQPGGCMQSYQRGGSTFDTGLHYVGGLDEGQPLHQAFKDLGLLELPWQRLDPEGFDRITIAGETYAFHQGYDEFVRFMAAHFPSERRALQQYADLLRRSDDEQLASLHNPGGKENAFLDKLFTTNAYQWLCETFRDPLLVNVISGASLKMELHKETLPLFTFTHGNGSFIQSSWRLKGSGNALVAKLTDNIRHAGGEVMCGMRVTELTEHDGRIDSAVCSNGERFEADTFISDLHPYITCSLVKDSTLIKGIYKRRMARLENTFGMFTASLQLKPGALPYLNHNKFIYEKPNVWELSEENHDGYGVLVSCPWSDTGHAQTIDLLSPMLWSECLQWQDTHIGRRGEDYNCLKMHHAQRLIGIAEQQIPGLGEAVSSIHTSTPLTYRDYNNTPNGSAYGIRKDCANPMMTILTPRTPVPNLFLTGQNLMLHGLHGVTMTALFTCAAVKRHKEL